jgi:hypothetical protein
MDALPVIIDYSYLDKKIYIPPDGDIMYTNDPKKKHEISTLSELRSMIGSFIELELQSIQGDVSVSNFPDNYFAPVITIPSFFQIKIRPEDRELFVEQLMFDVLAWKYIEESPQMTLRQYSLTHSHDISDEVTDVNLHVDAVRKSMKSAISRQVNTMNNPAIRADIAKLGFDPDRYFEHLTQPNKPFKSDKKKPKTTLDNIYYNGAQNLITGKQYARSFIKGANYSRARIIEMFDDYDRFVHNKFMGESENSKDYFEKSLEFYFLEIYKRIDFMYKLAVRLEGSDAPSIDKEHPLVKRYHPIVLVARDSDGQLGFVEKHKYYRPMLMLEERWQKEELYKRNSYFNSLIGHHMLRAKVYEAFMYHCRFASNDYDEISTFIRDHYDVLSYHEPNKKWIHEDKEHKAEREIRVIKALEINEALFGDSGKRKPEKWIPPSKTDTDKT